MCKKQEVSNYTCHTLRKFYFCKFVVFSILLQTWAVHLEFSFIIYSALSTPPFSFYCTFWGIFWKARKNITLFENDSWWLFKIIFQSLIIYVVVRYTCKYIPSQNNIKTVVIVQNIDSKHKCWVNFQTSR